MKNLKIHVSHHLVVNIVHVVYLIHELYVLAYQITMELLPIVVQNVWSILIVLVTNHVATKNVLIHVLVHVDSMQFVVL